MPRFFFDVHDESAFRDETGLEFLNLQDAQHEALRAAGSMLSDRCEIWSTDPWVMEVRDETGSVVITLTFNAR